MSKTLVNINDTLMAKAKRISGLKKKVDIVNQALESFVREKEAESILDLKGKMEWKGDLKHMRKDRKVHLA